MDTLTPAGSPLSCAGAQLARGVSGNLGISLTWTGRWPFCVATFRPPVSQGRVAEARAAPVGSIGARPPRGWRPCVALPPARPPCWPTSRPFAPVGIPTTRHRVAGPPRPASLRCLRSVRPTSRPFLGPSCWPAPQPTAIASPPTACSPPGLRRLNNTRMPHYYHDLPDYGVYVCVEGEWGYGTRGTCLYDLFLNLILTGKHTTDVVTVGGRVNRIKVRLGPYGM